MKTYRIITTLLSAAVFVSCNYLDFDETNGLNTHDNIYKYFDNTKQMLTNVYSYIPQDFGAVEEAMRDCASDDAEFGNTGGGVQDFNNGNWSALRTHDTAWSLYNGIRAANEFIASIADVDFPGSSTDRVIRIGKGSSAISPTRLGCCGRSISSNWPGVMATLPCRPGC